MSREKPIARIRKICLALEGADEAAPFGHPWFRVKEKVFATAFEHDGVTSITVKTGLEDMGMFLEDARFTKAAYVGRYGWVTMSLSGTLDWEEIEALIRDSFQRVRGARNKTVRPN